MKSLREFQTMTADADPNKQDFEISKEKKMV